MAEKRKDSRGRNLPTGVTERSNGLFQGSYTIDGERRFVYGKDLKTVKAKLEQAKKDAEAGISSKNPSLNDFYDQYVQIKKLKVRETTLNTQLQVWDTYIRNGLGRRKIKSIHRSDIIRTLNDLLLEKNLSQGRVKLTQSVLSSVFQAAVDDDIITKNPARDVVKDLAKSSKAAKTKEVLNLSQAQRLFSFMDNNTSYSCYSPLLKTMFETGMRISETLGLTWRDVNFHDGTISVNHELQYKEHNGEIGFFVTPPKSKSSIRTIPMTQSVRAALLQQKQDNVMLGKSRDFTVDNLSDFIFLTKTSKPYVTSNINAMLSKVVNEINAQEKEQAAQEHREPEYLPHLSSHCFRHSFCTLMCESTDDIKAVQRLMGHSSSSITLDVYAHTSKEREQMAIESMEERLSI